jgi:hypothetical protein
MNTTDILLSIIATILALRYLEEGALTLSMRRTVRHWRDLLRTRRR